MFRYLKIISSSILTYNLTVFIILDIVNNKIKMFKIIKNNKNYIIDNQNNILHFKNNLEKTEWSFIKTNVLNYSIGLFFNYFITFYDKYYIDNYMTKIYDKYYIDSLQKLLKCL